MAEYLAQPGVQTALNATPIPFYASIPCTKRYILHEDGTGIFILRGITNNCSARYLVKFTGNIAVPEGGTAGPIAVALTVNGEPVLATRAIVTPAAVGDFFNVAVEKEITIPQGCCFNVAIEPVSAYNDTTAPAPAIDYQNARIGITRTA